ncbi:restriction endonuclease subunit S [uncultured Enterococcus sp.]|uniref:restriction endonuclease subunit S n=1 Tax=uncultured Enterococcus sp. TaxID=167972 RepID=UPI002585F366|nr:restriction endonuclease subunit S [uncultured Enterococcus sp.]
MANRKMPEIRFPIFEGDWEQRKLKELGDIQTGNTPPTSDKKNYNDNGFMWVTPTDIDSLVISDTKKKLSDIGKSRARTAKAGSILVTSIASIGKNTLALTEVGFNQQINALTPTIGNDSYFLLTQSEQWSEKMKRNAASGTMQIVNKTEFSNLVTFVPEFKEQHKIGNFFKLLDDTITLYQQELTTLKQIKQGFLQKMFPREGKKVPEIRFPEFTDDWEQHKLSDLMIFSNGINAPKENYGYGRKMISVMDILDKQPIKYENIRSSVKVDMKNEEQNKVEKGDLVFVRSSEIPEEVGWAKAYLDEEYALYSGFSIRGKKKKDFDAYFVELDLNFSNRKQIERKAGGSTRFNVSQSILNSLEILMPKNGEQTRIASFFKKLDETIALHQRDLELLKLTKKAFLQKLFV